MMPRRSQVEVDRLLSVSMLQAPFNVAVIDRDHKIVAANENFEEYFGNWRNRHCYEVTRENRGSVRTAKPTPPLTMDVSAFPMKSASIVTDEPASMSCT
jgi:hypothetical protein